MRNVCAPIRWANRKLTMELTGIPEARLLELVNEGKVGARKARDEPKAACVFSVEDVEQWWREEAPKAGPFAVKSNAQH